MLKKQLNIDISAITFLLVIIFSIIFYYWGFAGLLFSDDFSYAYKANALLHQNLQLENNIVEHRLGMLAPVACLYYLFGFNDYTTTLFPFVCFLGILTVIFVYFRKLPVAAITALCLASLNYYSLYFSNKLFPDVPLSFFSLLSLTFLIKRENKPSWLMASGVVLTFFYAFLIKETILYCLPFYFLICIKDISQRRNSKFWLISVALLIFLLTVYLLVYHITTGNAFYRFKIIMDGHYISGGSYYDKPFTSLLKRITYEPLLMFISSQYIIPLVLGGNLLFEWKFLSDKEKYWVYAAFLLLATFWWGTTSLRVYNPIVLNPRMFILLVPVWSIVAGYSVQRALNKPILIKNFSLSFLLITLICFFYLESLKLTVLYGCLFIYFSLFYSVVFRERIRVIIVAGLYLILLVHPLFIIHKNSRQDFNTLELVFQKVFRENEEHKAVLTDPIIQYGYKYFYKFNELPGLKVYSYEEFDKFRKDSANMKFVLLNRQNIDELITVGESIPDLFTRPSVLWESVINSAGVTLYRIRQ